MIDKETYKLGSNNYIKEVTVKDKIVIGNTFTTDMRHYAGWLKRWNGNYNKTAMYTITLGGDVYEHFPPNFYSNFMNDSDFNESSISILLENEGWLMRDVLDKKRYINYIGHIYKREDEILYKKWRKYNYWAPYTEKQMESTINLVKKLCSDFNIPLEVVSHNTQLDDIDTFNGVLYKSNFTKYYTDVNPAWDFTTFKNKIELN